MLLVLHQTFEQIARDVVLDAVAVGRRFLIKVSRADLGGEVAFDDFPDVLADPQRIKHLHVGKAVEENDAVGEAVGVVHLLDRFLAPLLGELQQAPVMQQPEMQPILVDGGELVAQALVEIFDDLCVALHDALQLARAHRDGPANATKSHCRQEQPCAESIRQRETSNPGCFRRQRARTRHRHPAPRPSGCADIPGSSSWRKPQAPRQ